MRSGRISAGELDLTNARDLEEQLAEAFDRSIALVLDLGRVVFIDSAALNVLFRVARRNGTAQLCLVVGPASPIARTLEIVGLPRLVTTRASVEEAVSALSSAPA